MPKDRLKPFQQQISKPWGYELILTGPDSPVTGKILHLNAGCRFSYQYHDQKEEILTLVSGEATLVLEKEEISMTPRHGYHIKPFCKHRVAAVSDCDIFEVSTPEQGITVRLEDDYHRPDETEKLRTASRRH